jgi:hypothetical protein
MYRTAPHRTAVYCTAPHCTARYCTALHCTALHATARRVLNATHRPICGMHACRHASQAAAVRLCVSAVCWLLSAVCWLVTHCCLWCHTAVCLWCHTARAMPCTKGTRCRYKAVRAEYEEEARRMVAEEGLRPLYAPIPRLQAAELSPGAYRYLRRYTCTVQ